MYLFFHKILTFFNSLSGAGVHFQKRGIQVDVQPENADDATDGHHTPEEEVSQIDDQSQIDEGSEPAQSPEPPLDLDNRRSVRVDDEVKFNFRV